MPAPARAADPLQPPRWTDDRVSRHRIAGRIVHVMRPLVDVGRPGLDRRGPLVAAFDVGNAVRRQHAKQLIHGSRTEVLGDDEIHEIVDQRQVPAVELLDRRLAVKPERADMLPGFVHALCISVEAEHQVAVVGPQGGRQLAVTAAEVNDQAAPDAG